MNSRIYQALCAVFTLLFICHCSSSSSTSNLVGKLAPLTRVQMMSGEFLPINEYRGKTVVLTFWASWCSRSNQTITEIGNFAQRFASRPDIVFLNVSVDKAEDLEKVQTRLRDPALSTTQNAFSGNAEYDEAFMSFRCNDLPRIFIINPSGLIIAEGRNVKVVQDNLH